MKLILQKKIARGFSLLELMVVITIIAILAGISGPAFNGAIAQTRMTSDAMKLRNLVVGFTIFAQDWDGYFPYVDEDGNEFTTSTEAFQFYLEETESVDETQFYIKGNPEKLVKPNNDGTLEQEENCLSYVANQSDTTAPTSPLVVQEMTGAGTFGENHPYLKNKKAIVGYCGGYGKIEKLTSSQAGATIKGEPGSGIDNIFEEQTIDEDGKASGGYLAVSQDNILHPQ